MGSGRTIDSSVSNAERIESDGERKQVTVLFADVKGSMDLAEGQDPEQWRRIMQRFFAILADGVHRFEGTVDKFTGDGIMAVFGAPVAQEDHARRACYAALTMLDDIAAYAADLRRTEGLSFSTRIGVNSGEVIAGAIGEGGEGGYTAIGHTVGLAQRMEALAEPGKAYLTEAAAELAGGYFELDDLGEFEIKGASRARPRVRAGRGRRRPLAARPLARAGILQLRRPSRGDGGAGSGAGPGQVRRGRGGGDRRRARSRQEPPLPRVRRARPRGGDRGLRGAGAGARSRDPVHAGAADAARLLRHRRRRPGADRAREDRRPALLLDPAFAEELPVLFDFLGVPDPDRPAPQLSPEARQRALREIVCRLVQAPSRRQPVVTVIEDLHWIDGGSAALLGGLLAAVEGTQTLVVVNFRPEYERDWSGPPDYHEIELAPLGPADTAELLRDLAGGDPSLDGLAELVHERTAGNPFFVEEIVRELAESGGLEGERGAYRLARPVEEAGVPASVQTVLAARIDRLDPDAKLLLQAASVAGKEVPERALEMVAGFEEEGRCGAALGELIEAGFLYEAEVYPERVLAFRHPLTREVAYGTQLAEQRAATHAAVARATIELNPERGDELAALIASHMESGSETREAARWSARAAHWAGGSHPGDALRLWRRVTELAAELPEDEESSALAVTSRLLQLLYAWRLGMESAEEERIAAEAEEIATRTGDLRSLAMLKAATSTRPGLEQEMDAWLAAVAEVNRLADESGDLSLRAALRGAGAYAYLCAGDFDGFERSSTWCWSWPAATAASAPGS